MDWISSGLVGRRLSRFRRAAQLSPTRPRFAPPGRQNVGVATELP
jgi:hypothetical protein